jgi:hypothetical protein
MRASAYVCIRLHTAAYGCRRLHAAAYVSIRIRQHTQHALPSSRFRTRQTPTHSIRQHTSAYAYVSIHIRQHTSAYASIRLKPDTSTPLLATCMRLHTAAYGCIRLHTAAYFGSPTRARRCLRHACVSIRQHTHTAAYGCIHIRQHTSAYASIRLKPDTSTPLLATCMRLHTPAYASIRLHTSAYVSIR